jgi:CRP-like cAMP-binding protein
MPAVSNELLDLLPRTLRARLIGQCEPVSWSMAQILCEPGEPTRHVYFPIQGFVSLITSIDDVPILEVGMIGAEGMLGAQLALGVRISPLHAVVQGAGSALRMSAGGFQKELAQSAALRSCVQRYLYVLMKQLATSAGCLRFHDIGNRLARWLLMSQDRAHKDKFHITHEFMAYMLGMRRVGITTTAGVLQRNGLIAYTRGEIVVLDRAGLEKVACSCYQVDRQTYADILH